eukprot:6392164-Prymnesium_polylepis.1
MDQTQLDTAWHSRSNFMNESKRHRQQRAVREAQAKLPDGEWEHFLARCRAVAEADEACGVLVGRPRGRGRAQLIGQRANRHVQRRETQVSKQQASMQARVRAAQAALEFRATQIARLRHALTNHNCASRLLQPTEGDAAPQPVVSCKQAV